MILQTTKKRSQTQTVSQNELTEKYVSDEWTRQNHTKTTKWRGVRQSTWKKIQSTDNKDDPTSWKRMESQTKKAQKMFNKELKDLKNKDEQYNNWNER